MMFLWFIYLLKKLVTEMHSYFCDIPNISRELAVTICLKKKKKKKKVSSVNLLEGRAFFRLFLTKNTQFF